MPGILQEAWVRCVIASFQTAFNGYESYKQSYLNKCLVHLIFIWLWHMYILHCSIFFVTPNFAFRVSKSPRVWLRFFALFCSCQDYNHFIWELFLLRFYWGCFFISQKVLDSANIWIFWVELSFLHKFHYFEHKLTFHLLTMTETKFYCLKKSN